jgi:gliding motility-associated-like protein
MIIFNRWGDEIYRSNNINRGWNGGINGYYAPDGTYNYIIKIFDLSGQPLFGKGEFYGTVTLLR